MRVSFVAIAEKFGKKGEKTGWSYILIPQEIADRLNPGVKKTFRVKGLLNNISINQLALTPMGEGNFILAIKKDLQKQLGFHLGMEIKTILELDESQVRFNEDLMLVLSEYPEAVKYLHSLAPSHQLYFSKWIDSAKTLPTKEKRIAAVVNALLNQWDYGMMVRNQKRH